MKELLPCPIPQERKTLCLFNYCKQASTIQLFLRRQTGQARALNWDSAGPLIKEVIKQAISSSLLKNGA